jgi:polygalacturonase
MVQTTIILTVSLEGVIHPHPMTIGKSTLSRRTFLQTVVAPLLIPAQIREPWSEVSSILARVKPPKFPARDFNVIQFGAVANSGTDSTEAISKAITACHDAGGGRVVIPAGEFMTGPIRLRTGINLHLAEGSVLKFATDPRRYLPVVFTRWEGTELMNYSPFIYAFEEKDLAITGSGTIDGRADETHWWNWRTSQAAARQKLVEFGAKGAPVSERVFGEGSNLRPNFIQPYRCRNILIEGITIRNSPMWEIHPVLSTNITVRGVTIVSHGPNNDGCNPESCRDVLIERCSFDTGDDCIALKSGRNNDGRRVGVPVENVIVRDCTMKDGHGGVTIGSEISGGARNIYAEHCRMDSPRLDRALRIKTNSVRGGIVERVFMRDVTVGQVAEAVVTIDFLYEEGDAGSYPPVVRNVEVRNVRSRKSTYALLLRGYRHAPINDVRLTNCVFENVAKPDVLENVKSLRLSNVKINGKTLNESITR